MPNSSSTITVSVDCAAAPSSPFAGGAPSSNDSPVFAPRPQTLAAACRHVVLPRLDCPNRLRPPPSSPAKCNSGPGESEWIWRASGLRGPPPAWRRPRAIRPACRFVSYGPCAAPSSNTRPTPLAADVFARQYKYVLAFDFMPARSMHHRHAASRSARPTDNWRTRVVAPAQFPTHRPRAARKRPQASPCKASSATNFSCIRPSGSRQRKNRPQARPSGSRPRPKISNDADMRTVTVLALSPRPRVTSRMQAGVRHFKVAKRNVIGCAKRLGAIDGRPPQRHYVGPFGSSVGRVPSLF